MDNQPEEQTQSLEPQPGTPAALPGAGPESIAALVQPAPDDVPVNTEAGATGAGFLVGKAKDKEEQSFIPWIVAGVVVLLVAGLFALGGRNRSALPDNASGAPDAYAAQLAITDLTLSQSSNIAGSEITYVDGVIANHGSRTVDAITVQATFNVPGAPPQVVPNRLSLIRTREPYIDIEAVSADPIKPGESKPFRLIFEHVSDGWDQKNPVIQIMQVHVS